MRIIVDNKLRGAYGESDLNKGTIRINKKRHFDPSYKRLNPAKDGHEKLYSTVKHEMLHHQHPDKSETEVRKMEKSTTARMSTKQKAALTNKLK